MNDNSNTKKPFYSRDWFRFITVPILCALITFSMLLSFFYYAQVPAQVPLSAAYAPGDVTLKAIASGAGENEAWILTSLQTNRIVMNSATESMIKFAQKEAHERKLRIISIAELSGYLTGGAGRGLICVVEPINAIAPPPK